MQSQSMQPSWYKAHYGLMVSQYLGRLSPF